MFETDHFEEREKDKMKSIQNGQFQTPDSPKLTFSCVMIIAYNTVQYSTVQYNTLQYSTVLYTF